MVAMGLDSKLKEEIMKKEEFIKGCFRIVADEGKILQSKATHFDEELGQDVPNISGKVIYLGKNDKEENYVEVEEGEEHE